jgi:peptidoglycan/xylan/chitin deacetylase (PgdA/CDA1 family)
MFCGVRFLSLNIFGKSVCKIKNAPKNTIYLTFDDGPNPNITPRVLELLKKYNQKATFFCIAEKAKKYPEIVRKIVEDGHTLGSHDLHHRWTSNFRMTKKLTEEIGESVRILEEAANCTKIRLYRPPVGLSNPHLFGVLKKFNLQCVGWSKSTRDGGNRILSAIKNIPNLAKATAAQDGDIILLHDNSPVQNEELFLEKFNELLANLQEFRKKSLPLSV